MADGQTIQGLPPGAVVRPISGLPPGAIVRPVGGQEENQSPDVTPEPTLAQRGMTGLKNLGIGALKSGVSLMSTGDEWARKHLPAFFTNTDMGFGPPANLQHVHEAATPQGTAQKVGYGLGEAAQFLIPGGAEEKAVSLAPAVLRPAARIGAAALSSGLVNKAQGGNFGTGALMGGAGGAIGEGLQKVAPTMAETALRIGKRERAFGREGGSIGRAVLEDTSGVRPETIERTGRETVNQLTPRLEQVLRQSAQPVSMIPARTAIATPMEEAAANEAAGLHGQLSDIHDFLHTGRVSGEPIPENVTPIRALQLKRGLSDEYLGKWSPDVHGKTIAAGRGAYHALREGIHEAVPESAAIDERISNLLPAIRRAESVSREAPFLQRVGGRLRAHTGVLAGGAGLGGLLGYREGGTKGMIEGGLVGLTAPELISSPEGQMAVARMMHGAGTLRPATAAALQLTSRKGGQ